MLISTEERDMTDLETAAAEMNAAIAAKGIKQLFV